MKRHINFLRGKFNENEFYIHPRLGRVCYQGTCKNGKALVKLTEGRSKFPVLIDRNQLKLEPIIRLPNRIEKFFAPK